MTQPLPADLLVRSIGRVRGGRTSMDDSDHWGDVTSEIVVDPGRFAPDGLVGLSDFSHVEVVFVFDRVTERSDYTIARPGRGRADLPAVGVFADRGPRRPNRIGTTACRIVRVEDCSVWVRGLDALDGSPVLDLKPVMRQLLPESVSQPAWVDDLMSRYLA